MKKILAFKFILLFVVTNLRAQEIAPQLMQILPSSPEAAALTANSLGGVSLFTGRAQASIPLHTLTVGNFSLPIGLQYNSEGFRIDENPTFEGLSWSLSCVGLVNRTVHGKPDDDPNIVRVQGILSSNPPNPPSNDDIRNYYEKTSNSTLEYDAEPDEFSYTGPGISGKFIVGNSGEIISFPYSNNKILIGHNAAGYINSFTITTTNGNVYVFDYIERVISHNVGGQLKSRLSLFSAFYLTSITLPAGEYIHFNYQGFSKTVYSGISESIYRGTEQAPYVCSDGSHCPGLNADPDSYVKKANYQNSILAGITHITTSNGQDVTFNYGTTPPNEGNVTTDCLSSVNINSGDFNRIYNFVYSMPSTSSFGYAFTSPANYIDKNVHTRFFLKEINYLQNISYGEKVSFKIDYKENEGLPSNLSCAQDHLGFYNGAGNSTLLPYQSGETNWQSFNTANRDYVGVFAEKGMLDKITFPTRGYEKFNYEPNTISEFKTVTNPNVTIAAGGIASGHRTNFYSTVFHIYKNQMVTLNIGGNGGSTNIAQASGQLVLMPDQTIVDGVSTNSYNVNLTPGDYQLRVSVRKDCAGDIDLMYDPTDINSMAWVSKESGGVRVKSIESYDPLSDKSKYKYYSYAKKDQLNVSSGSSLYVPLYIEQSKFIRKCPSGEQANCIGCNGYGCDIYVLSSSSVIPSSMYGEHMKYEYVTEADDNSFLNGGIQHKFDIQPTANIAPQVITGFPILNIPFNIISASTGNEIETLLFDKSLNAVQKTVNTFENGPLYQKSLTARSIRRTWPGPPPAYLDPHDGYDESDYQFYSYWNRLASTVTTDYVNGNQMVNTNSYTYNESPSASPINTSVLKTETSDSKNQLLSTQFKYPTDYTTDPISQVMVTKNMIDEPLNIKKYRSNAEIASTTTVYDWFNNNSFLKPKNIKQSINGNPEENKINYYDYNLKGNPLRMSKDNDVNLAYIWGYDHNFPIAEVNTDKTILYSSFEESQLNSPSESPLECSWNYIEPTYFVSSVNAMTGKNYYQQSNFEFSRILISIHGTYVVSYWSNNNTPYSINIGAYDVSLTGWPKLIKTVNHNGMIWNLFEHRISIVDNVKLSIAGSGAIDELRFYPLDAVMKTFTYSPYVGISSQCDENNNITYFEYDGLQRLTLVRDIDKNILKKICYNYAGQPENCGVIRYFNDPQQNSFTPTTCPSNTTANPVIYVVPANTYSSTISLAQANQLALADLAANGQQYANDHPNCTAISCNTNNCSGKCINGTCEQGVHKLVSKARHAEFDENGNRIWVWVCDWITCYSDHTSEPWYPPYGTPEANCASVTGAATGGICP